MNLILGDVEETIYVVDINEETGKDTVRVGSHAHHRLGFKGPKWPDERSVACGSFIRSAIGVPAIPPLDARLPKAP